MKHRLTIIAANWKMYKTPQEGYQFARRLATRAQDMPGVKLILFPSATGLYHIHEVLKQTTIDLGGQQMHAAAEGAYTGENAARMLVASGCQWVLVGHSERRNLFHETDRQIQAKTVAALEVGLKVILCVGEQLEEREDGRTEEVLRLQLEADLALLAEFPLGRLVIAYEPVWAIGTGVVASPAQAGEAHARIRQLTQAMYPDLDDEEIRVIYGGSVNPSNAGELIRTPGVDGFLIGGASLDIDEYSKIAQISRLEAEVI